MMPTFALKAGVVVYHGVAYGCAAYYVLRARGWRDSRPIGDVTGMCIMVPPGFRPYPGFAFV